MPGNDQYQKCNSPFWYKPPSTVFTPWFSPLNLLSPNRTAFGRHAWTEVFLGGQGAPGVPRVLETCHAALGGNVNTVVLAYGTATRAQYYASAVNDGALTNGRRANYQPTCKFHHIPIDCHNILQHITTSDSSIVKYQNPCLCITDSSIVYFRDNTGNQFLYQAVTNQWYPNNPNPNQGLVAVLG